MALVLLVMGALEIPDMIWYGMMTLESKRLLIVVVAQEKLYSE